LEIYFDAAQFPPAAVWPNAVLCIYTALLCDNAAVLLENIRENVEMISKRKGRRNGALPTVRRSIATAANFFFLYCYMCCSSRAFYIYTCIFHKKSFISLHQKILYNNNLGAQSLNSKRGNSQREQQQIHDFPVSRKHYRLSLSLLHLSLFILDLHRSAWSLQQHIANSYSRAQRVSNSSRESKTIENGPNKNRRRRIIQEVCAFAALDDSQLRSLIAC
jgi:hypothetical protein